MTQKPLERLQAELSQWRGRLDHLRVQANLGRREAQDELRELGQRLEPAFDKAKRFLDEAISSGTSEARTLGKSLLAGWDEVRRTHHTLSREAEDERSKRAR